MFTNRLLLRDFTETDIDALFALLGDTETNRFLPWFPLNSMEETERFLHERIQRSYTKGGFFTAVCLKEKAVPIGYVSLSDTDSHDLGYALRKEFWQQGFTGEACAAVLAHGRKIGLPYLTATHDRNNPASGAVMKKIGMTYRYSYEELVQPKNELVTFRMYQINLDGNRERLYTKYWDAAAVRFVEGELT